MDAQTLTRSEQLNTLQEMTLTELRSLKADWLQAAQENGYLATCRLVARTLGTPGPVEYRALWTAYTWRADRLTLTLYEGCGRWLPWAQTYERITVLTAQVRGCQVLCYRTSTDPNAQADNFIVPGGWLDQVLAVRERAADLEAHRSIQLVENERRRLLAQLLAGVDL